MRKLYVISLLSLALMCSMPFGAVVSADTEIDHDLQSMIDRMLYDTHGYSATVCYAEANDFIVSERENGDWRGIAVFSKRADDWHVDFLNGHAMRHQAYVSSLDVQESPAQIRWTYDTDGIIDHFVFEGIKDEAGTYHWRIQEYARSEGDTVLWNLTSDNESSTLWRTESYQPDIKEPVVSYHEGLLQTNLQTFKLDSFPTNEEELVHSLVVIPDEQRQILLSKENEYTMSIDAAWVECHPDLIYPVYSGPDPEYLRAASGKAEVSTNDSIWVFGEENGYLMMYYTIGRERIRVGYIPVDVLAYEEDIETLRFLYTPGRIARECDLTDDPIQSCEPLMVLPEGSAISYLSLFHGDWAYVETKSPEGKLVRGFVLTDNIAWN